MTDKEQDIQDDMLRAQLWKTILANQDGIWKIRPIHIQILDKRVLSKNEFSKSLPDGGARTGPCGPMWGRGSELSSRECVHSLAVIGPTARRLAGNRWTHTQARTHGQKGCKTLSPCGDNEQIGIGL